MKKKILIAMVMLGAATLVGCSAENKTEQTKTEAENEAGTTEQKNDEGAKTDTDSDTQNEGKTAANGLFGEFETTTNYGTPVTQDIFTEADLTMVNIWGTFCSPCIREMPDLGELADEYADKGVQIVGIISDVTTTFNVDVDMIIQETGADYTHLIVNQSLWNAYLSGVQVVPTTVFLDSEGKQVGQVYTGSRDKAAWAEIIDEMLELAK